MKRILFVSSTIERFSSQFLQGVAAKSQGEYWLLYRKQYNRNHIKSFLSESSLIQSSDFDGALILTDFSEAFTDENAGVELIRANRNESSIPVVFISYDYHAIAQACLSHFLELGIKDLGFFKTQESAGSVMFCDDFVKAVGNADCEINTFNSAAELPRQMPGVWLELRQWIKGLTKPAAVLVATDVCGQEVLLASRQAGVNVPEELAVMGIGNDLAVCLLSKPQISSLSLNFEGAGYEASGILADLMDTPETRVKFVSIRPFQVVARKSTDTLAINDALVRRAVKYIQKNLDKPLQVPDVVDACGTSKTVLYKHFQKVLGRSVNCEIKRLRCAQAKLLLKKTDLPINDIAFKCGLTPDHFARFFKKERGICPNEYRRISKV